MPGIALFDFDGTITTNDNFVGFVKFYLTPLDLLKGYIRLLPSILGYRLGLLSSTNIRTQINHMAFRGRSSDDLRLKGEAYARKYLSGFVRPKAQKRIDWHKQQGDIVVVVSASLDVYLKPWCDAQGLVLICSRLQSVGGLLTGDFLGEDCCGRFKVEKIKEQFDLSKFDRIYAYGDSQDDLPMLDLAHEPYYRWMSFTKSR